MGIEIERKFLVKNDDWKRQIQRSEQFRQGYLTNEKHLSVRVRLTDNGARLTIKGATNGLSRTEYEYPIPKDDAEHLLDELCTPPLIEKTRHWLQYGAHTWEVDVFEGDNQGLVVAEVELEDTDEQIDLPDWLGEDVSDDPRYLNASLVRHPYCQW